MFNSRLVREGDALLQFEVLSWMIRKYGSPGRPDVPSPLHKSAALEDLLWADQDTRTIHDWADDTVNIIRTATRSEDLALSLTSDPSLTNALFYAPEKCSTPGYMTVQTVLHIAERRTYDARHALDLHLDSFASAIVLLCAAAYTRQGFVLANRTGLVVSALSETKVPARLVENTLCFSTCLALRARRQTAEQIIATYGPRMSKRFRRKVRQACVQIDSFEPELKLLQVIADPVPVRPRMPQRRSA